MDTDTNKLDKESKLQVPQNNPQVEELLESPESKRGSLGIRLTPSGDTPDINKETAQAEIFGFQSNVEASVQKLASDPQEELGPQKAAALLLHSKGAFSQKIAEAARKANFISGKEKEFFDHSTGIMKGLETIDPERAETLQMAADYPDVEFFEPTQTEIAQYYEQPPETGYVFFNREDGGLSPLPPPESAPIDNVAFNQIRGMGRQAFDNWGFGKAKQKVGGKIKEEIGKKAVKEGAKKVAEKGLAVAAGAPTGGIGTLAVEAASKIAGALKKVAGNILSALTGEEDQRKALAMAGLAVAAGGVLLGSATLAIGGAVVGGLGAISAFGIAGAAGGIAATIGAGFLAIASAFLAAILVPILVTFVAFVILTVFILIIINNSAYVTPEGGLVVPPISGVESPYINIEKIANASGHIPGPYLEFDNNDLDGNLTVTYTITVTAKEDSLTNISFVYDCNVIKQGTSPPCPNAPNIPNPPGVISPAQPFTFSYDMTYQEGETYEDTLVIDTFTVTADAPEQDSAQSATSATIKIGNPPEECPSGWPVRDNIGRTYYITQGPFSTWTHTDRDAIDVSSFTDDENNHLDDIIATHFGTITDIGVDQWGGLHVEIQGSCGQYGGFHSRHVHFISFAPDIEIGDTVHRGTYLGIMGDTGWASHRHDHYEFTENTIVNMEIPYIPVNVPVGCVLFAGCGSITIP